MNIFCGVLPIDMRIFFKIKLAKFCIYIYNIKYDLLSKV